jgi:hypothetical protein
MNVSHPLAFLPNNYRKPLFLTSLALTLLIFAVFRVLDAPLRADAAPSGVVSFELARTPENASRILDSWNERAKLFAAFGLGFDYLFMPAYALALSLGILLAASRHRGTFATLGAWMGWGALAAPFFDALENFGLVRVLLYQTNSPWPEIAFWCATMKFTLLIIGLVYALIGWLWPKAG